MGKRGFPSLIVALILLFSGCGAASADDGELVIVFSCRGKTYRDGDTVTVSPGEKLSISAKVFVKQFKVKGGVWKKNSRGEWRFFKEIRGCTVGVGVGKMSLKIMKEDFSWNLDGTSLIGSERTLSWTVPALTGGSHQIAFAVAEVGQVKTEGTASLHGFHVDYNLPGAGKRRFSGKAALRLKVQKAS